MAQRVKKKPTASNKPRANLDIRDREIRVIGAEGEQLGIMSPADAMKRCEEVQLDLVEVAPTAKPPVCRIMDFGKFKYEQSRKERVVKSSQKGGHLKEVKFRPYTGEHDLDFKINHAKEFLLGRNKVKITLMFRGREMAYRQKGWEIMAKVKERLDDVGQAEYAPKFEGRNMIMVLAPKSLKGE